MGKEGGGEGVRKGGREEGIRKGRKKGEEKKKRMKEEKDKKEKRSHLISNLVLSTLSQIILQMNRSQRATSQRAFCWSFINSWKCLPLVRQLSPL